MTLCWGVLKQFWDLNPWYGESPKEPKIIIQVSRYLLNKAISRNLGKSETNLLFCWTTNETNQLEPSLKKAEKVTQPQISDESGNNHFSSGSTLHSGRFFLSFFLSHPFAASEKKKTGSVKNGSSARNKNFPVIVEWLHSKKGFWSKHSKMIFLPFPWMKIIIRPTLNW